MHEDFYLRFLRFQVVCVYFWTVSCLHHAFAEFNALFLIENLVIARCFPNFSAYLVKFLQLKFRESVQLANIAKILPSKNMNTTSNYSMFLHGMSNQRYIGSISTRSKSLNPGS